MCATEARLRRDIAQDGRMTIERLVRVCTGAPYELKIEDIAIPHPLPSPHTDEDAYTAAAMAYHRNMKGKAH